MYKMYLIKLHIFHINNFKKLNKYFPEKIVTWNNACMASGFIYVNISNKYVPTYFNLTEDGSLNLCMFDNIPKSRHVIWRNNEYKYYVYVIPYIKLSHSR